MNIKFPSFAEIPSPFTIPTLNPSNTVSYKEDTVEKGETDTLRKETVRSKFEDKEHTCEENKYKQEYSVDFPPGQKNFYSKTTEAEEKAVKIVTSVSVHDMENSSPKVIFQQSHEPSSESSSSSTPVTNIFNINCTELRMKLEIQETLQVNAYGIESKCIFMNENKDIAEMVVKHKCERTWTLGHESSAQSSQTGTSHNKNQTITTNFACGRMSKQTEIDSKSVCSTNTWGKPTYCQCCSNHTQQKTVDFKDQLSHVPPIQQPEDRKYNTLEDLTEDLASIRITACSPTDKHQRTFHRNYSTESGSLFSSQAEERKDMTVFELSSESDNCEPMFRRPSTSTNRSSFTNDFIYCQRKNSWMRKNSVPTVENRLCSLLKKRRQTFPGTSVGPGLMGEDLQLPCHKSFSSFLICSLPFQSERLINQNLFDKRFSMFERRASFEPVLEVPKPQKEEQPFLTSFCFTSSNNNPDLCPTCEHDQSQSSTKQQVIDRKQSIIDCDHKDNQREVVDMGLDMRTVHSPEHLGEEGHQRGLAIRVIPPPCSGSKEQMTQIDPYMSLKNGESKGSRTNDSVLVSPEHSQSPVVTESADPLWPNFLQEDSKQSLSKEGCAEKPCQSALEVICMPTSWHVDVNLPKENEVEEKSESKPLEQTFSSQALQVMSDEMKNAKVAEEETTTEKSKKPADNSLCHTNKVVSTKELFLKTGKVRCK